MRGGAIDRMIVERGCLIGVSRIVKIRSPGGFARRSRMILDRQLAQRQEKFRRDDQYRQRPVERQQAVHQPQADFDCHQRRGDRAAPFQHQPGLEGRAQDFHGRVSVVLADIADVFDLLAAAPKHFERRQALQHVEEERAHPAQLQEALFGDLFCAAADQCQQQYQDGTGEQQDRRRERIEQEDDEQDEDRHDYGQQARRLVNGDVFVEDFHPFDGGVDKLAAAFALCVGRAEGEEVPGESFTQAAFEAAGRALRQHIVAPDEQPRVRNARASKTPSKGATSLSTCRLRKTRSTMSLRT